MNETAEQHAEDMVKGHYETHREYKVARAYLDLLKSSRFDPVTVGFPEDTKSELARYRIALLMIAKNVSTDLPPWARGIAIDALTNFGARKL